MSIRLKYSTICLKHKKKISILNDLSNSSKKDLYTQQSYL